MTNKKGLLFVVSAPAGCGKDTILEQLLRKTNTAAYSVSATPRAPRSGEIDGVHYYFLTRERFKEMIDNGEVLEYTEYCGNYYGTPKKGVEELLGQGRDVILKIETEGAMNIRRLYPEACLVFILPPSMEVLKTRLKNRGTETEETIERRTEQAYNELSAAVNYDYFVVNDELSEAVDDLCAVIRAEKLRRERSMDVLAAVKGDGHV